MLSNAARTVDDEWVPVAEATNPLRFVITLDHFQRYVNAMYKANPDSDFVFERYSVKPKFDRFDFLEIYRTVYFALFLLCKRAMTFETNSVSKAGFSLPEKYKKIRVAKSFIEAYMHSSNGEKEVWDLGGGFSWVVSASQLLHTFRGAHFYVSLLLTNKGVKSKRMALTRATKTYVSDRFSHLKPTPFQVAKILFMSLQMGIAMVRPIAQTNVSHRHIIQATTADFDVQQPT